MEQVRAQNSQVQQPDIGGVNKSDMSDLTPAQIRESIQWLVAKDQVEEAHEFVKKSLVLFPDNEEVLAIGSLVSVVRQDWQEAVLLLKKLYSIQGDRTAALTYQLHIRALRCNFQLDQALDMAKNGLCRFPENLEIVEDCAVLAEQLQDWKTAVVAIGILIDIRGPQNTEDLQIRLKISKDMLDKQNTEKKQKNRS